MSGYVAKGVLLMDAKRRVGAMASLASVARIEYELRNVAPGKANAINLRAYGVQGFELCQMTGAERDQCAAVVESVREIAAKNFVYAR